MRSLALAMLATSLLVAPPAFARDRDELPVSIKPGPSLEDPARWAPRHDSRLARYIITTEDGKVDLLLTPSVVAFQLSDRTMRHVDSELREKEYNEDENGPLGNAIKNAVIASVRVFLKHSAECPLRELRDVDYRDGALVFITRDGDRLFNHIRMDDDDLVSSFSERDARAFVQEFRRVRGNNR